MIFTMNGDPNGKGEVFQVILKKSSYLFKIKKKYFVTSIDFFPSSMKKHKIKCFTGIFLKEYGSYFCRENQCARDSIKKLV